MCYISYWLKSYFGFRFWYCKVTSFFAHKQHLLLKNNLKWINPPNLVNPCFGKDDLWIELWVLFTFVSPIPTRRARRFYLCFRCFLCDSIKPRRGFQISSIRSIVPQELVFIKTYPFGMIKQIQRIYGIYLNPHTGFYWWTNILNDFE